jgi:hypothetical protein
VKGQEAAEEQDHGQDTKPSGGSCQRQEEEQGRQVAQGRAGPQEPAARQGEEEAQAEGQQGAKACGPEAAGARHGKAQKGVASQIVEPQWMPEAGARSTAERIQGQIGQGEGRKKG